MSRSRRPEPSSSGSPDARPGDADGPGPVPPAPGTSPSPARAGSQVVALVALLRRNADFRRLFAAAVVSFLGDWFALVAVSGLVEDVTGNQGSTALVYAAQVLPAFLFSPLAGVAADRFDRKRVMVSANLVLLVPSLALLAAGHWSNAWLAIACVGAISALAAFVQPVVNAVVPNVVDAADLSLAQASIGSVWGSMLFVGAALGGLVTAVFGRQASFLVDAGTFLLAAVLIWRIRRPFSRGRVVASASVLAHLGEVWDFIRPRKVTKAFMLTKASVGVGNGVVGLLPVFALDRFGAGDAGIGILLAARGLGSLVGPYLGRAVHRDDGRRIVVVTGLSIVMFGTVYLLLPGTGSLWVAAAVVAVAHVGGGNQWVTSTVGLQMTTPDHVAGRVLSLDYAMATLGMGTSALLAGIITPVVGLDASAYGFAALAVVAGVGWLVWTRDLWGGATDPIADARRDTAR